MSKEKNTYRKGREEFGFAERGNFFVDQVVSVLRSNGFNVNTNPGSKTIDVTDCKVSIRVSREFSGSGWNSRKQDKLGYSIEYRGRQSIKTRHYSEPKAGFDIEASLERIMAFIEEAKPLAESEGRTTELFKRMCDNLEVEDRSGFASAKKVGLHVIRTDSGVVRVSFDLKLNEKTWVILRDMRSLMVKHGVDKEGD